MKKEQVPPKIPFPFNSAEFLSNPYPAYDKLRSEHRIYKVNSFKYPGWYITGYEEAVAILKDINFKNRIPLPQTSKKYEHLKNIQDNMMLFKNQQDHIRLRKLISKGFTPSVVEGCRPFIEKTVDNLINSVQNEKRMEVVSDFAFPLASHVIARILGIPVEDRHEFKAWTMNLLPTIDFNRSSTSLVNGNETTRRLIVYFEELIKKRRQNLQNDLISSLIVEEEQGEKLTDEELLAACILLVIAGHETTVNLISNSVLSLLSNPEQLLLLKENPSLIGMAVEEFLRFESPTQMTARVAGKQMELNGETIREGEQVYILLGAANRDPKKFMNPNVLDITRNLNPHLAFGYGTHFCIGSTLARLESSMAIQTLLQRLDNLNLATSNVQWRDLIGFRSLKELPITFK